MTALLLMLALQGSSVEFNDYRIQQLEYNVKGLTEILTEMREDEAVAEENRLTTMERSIGDNAGAVARLAGHMTWLVRLLIGAVLTGAIGLLYRWKTS